MEKGLSRFGADASSVPAGGVAKIRGMVSILAGAQALAVALVMQPAPAAAHAGSDEEQSACTPDVFRLCMTAIPDENAIVACLKSKKSLLTPACAQVFSDAPPVRGRRGQ